MTVHLFPTQPRLQQPLPIARGWLILLAMVASWLLFVGLAYGALRIVGLV